MPFSCSMVNVSVNTEKIWALNIRFLIAADTVTEGLDMLF